MDEQKEPINLDPINYEPTSQPNNKKKKGCLFYVLSFIAGVLALFIIVGSCASSDKKKESNDTEEQPGTTSETISSDPSADVWYFLKAGEKGDHGKYVTYNKGTEFEKTFYAYYVPAAKYVAKNIGDYPTQINIYSDETVVTSEGYEEPVDAISDIMNINEEKEIVVPVGYHIEISEPTYIKLKMIDNQFESYRVVDTYYRLGLISGRFWIACFSIVENNGSSDLYLSNCEFEVIDEDGVLMANTDSQKIGPIVIKPGERGVFYSETTFYHALDNKYNFSVVPTFEISKSNIDCVRFDVSDIEVLTNSYNDICVRGKILNNTEKDYDYNYVVTYLYDSDDKIIGVISAFPDKFKSGQTIAFEETSYASFNNVKMSDVVRTETYSFPLSANVK